MHRITIFRRHKNYARLVSPYADHELTGAARAGFEAHLSACPACSESLDSARALKAAIATLPTISPSRSFQLTPGMVAASPARMPANIAAHRVPVYLALARVAAGLAVVAFVSVFAASLLTGLNSQDQAASTGTSMREADALADTAGGAEAPQSSSSKGAATRSPVLAPATSGAVAGQAVVSPVASGAALADQNALPSPHSGAPSSANTADGSQPGVVGDAVQEAPYILGSDRSAEGDFPWVIVLGSFAGSLVGLLLVLERRRRMHT